MGSLMMFIGSAFFNSIRIRIRNRIRTIIGAHRRPRAARSILSPPRSVKMKNTGITAEVCIKTRIYVVTEGMNIAFRITWIHMSIPCARMTFGRMRSNLSRRIWFVSSSMLSFFNSCSLGITNVDWADTVNVQAEKHEQRKGCTQNLSV